MYCPYWLNYFSHLEKYKLITLELVYSVNIEEKKAKHNIFVLEKIITYI
jgi:hypothetical protein